MSPGRSLVQRRSASCRDRGPVSLQQAEYCLSTRENVKDKCDRAPIRIQNHLTRGVASDTDDSGEGSEDHFQRELNLAGSSCGMIDDPEARTPQNVHGQPEVHQVESVEELGAELQGGGLGPRSAAQRGVFDQSHVEIVKTRSKESVSSQRSEAALVGPGAARNVDRDGKKGGVVVAPA